MLKHVMAVLCLSTIALTAPLASAHDVSASSVKVFVGESGALEVWQTTPHLTASGIAKKLNSALVEVAHVGDLEATMGIALGWHVVSESGTCSLKKQAFRRIHHETELQMRYLFACPDDARPTQISLPWLAQAPSDHFIMLEMNANGQKRMKIFERQWLSVKIPSAS